MEHVAGENSTASYTSTDIARFVVIGALAASIAAITAIALAYDPATIAPQLFYIPVLYSAYHYPRAGIVTAGVCAIVYEIVGSIFAFPDPVRAGFVIVQGVLFVVAGTLVAHLSETMNARMETCRTLQDEIELDNRRRRGIVSTVAHEMRTPLQPLMGYLNLLLSDTKGFGIDADTEKILARCLTCVERERQIINQMLEFSVLETGKLRLDYSVFSVPDLVSSLIATGGYASQAEIAMDLPKNLTFSADAGRFKTVIDSMLANAIAYSRPPRQIGIAYVSSQDDKFHRLAISDNGVGIAPEQLGVIFEPFQLADSDQLSRKYERIGLSLSIAKGYLDMHGGTITVESTVREGTTFTIHIPKTQVQAGDFHET